MLPFRLIKAFDKAGLLKKRTYSQIMSLLRRTKKIRVGGNGRWLPVKVNPSTEAMLAALDLAEPGNKPKRRGSGRPPKTAGIA